MNGRRIFIVSLLFAGALFGATDYFPLEVGNSWVYRVSQARLTRSATIQVEGIEKVEDRTYHKVRFLEESILLRYAGDGSLVKYKPETKSEGVWIPLPAQWSEGSSLRSEMDDCSRGVTLESAAAAVQTPLGLFDNALRLKYTPNCADAGTLLQYFVPYVGLVMFEQTSIAGPVVYELVYSRTGATNLVAQANAFTLSTDGTRYKVGTPALTARVGLHVAEPVQLTFPSGQSSDLRVLNDKGETVYFWSADKLFPAVFREESVQGERNWVMSVPISGLAPGRYLVEAWLTTQPKQYTASVSFEIVR